MHTCYQIDKKKLIYVNDIYMSYQTMCVTILPGYCLKSHVRPETDPRSGVGQSLSQLGVLGEAFPHVGIEFDHGVRVEFLAPKF